MYRIIDVDFNMSPMSEFPDGLGTYQNYFENKYGCHIKYDNQFLLVSEVKFKDSVQKIHLIPELLRKTGLSEK